MALVLATKEGLDTDAQLVVELAALLHDVRDYKYSGSDTSGPEAVRAFLESQPLSGALAQRVVQVVARVSYKAELAGAGAGEVISPELACVQDADRLDAMGAIGIARCFTFGGARGRPIYDPANPPRAELTAAEYGRPGGGGATVNHFHEKLLRLRDLMKTPAGREVAQGRHEWMEGYLARLQAELDALA